MVTFTFDKKLFFYLIVGFIITTIIGTVSHEFGHFAVAEYLGYDAKISYAYTNYTDFPSVDTETLFDKFYGIAN